MNKQMFTSCFFILVFVTNIFGAMFIFPDDPIYKKLLEDMKFSKREVMQPLAMRQTNATIIKVENQNTVENMTALLNLISDSVNNFGLKISNATDGFSNVKIISPINIAEALMLLWLGSNGQTFNEIANVMEFQNKSFNIYNQSQTLHEQFGRMLQSLEPKNKEEPQLSTASALFVQDGFPIGQKYSQIAKEVYRSNVTHLDFANKNVEAQKFINAWVSNNTNGLIKEILSTPPVPTTKILLTTALYFKGLWEHPFASELTHRAEFYLNGKADAKNFVMVDYMVNFEVFKYTYNKDLESEVLCLPYKGGTASMYIIAPKKSSIKKIQQVEKKLTTSVIENLINSLKPMQIGILMPKMEFESTISLSSTLKQLGLTSLFNVNTSSLNVLSPGFTYPNNTDQTIDEVRNKVSGKSPLYVEEVVHKVFISINELGTEAAAITDLLIPRGGMKKISLNQPFIFFIRHHGTNLNLFLSSVHVPVPNFK
ncbi:intracellular coagulation inhibitor 1-like [Chrysoperla carnea]|uniref:intracellular coagulation inhibitor 1-like n=1 Tax=Chrysoperla carnea TaxID=189513 RepID=UPI001D093282|nr:intracellular coagulation inhibitor 1-like [Chrysoperla carnea]